MSLVKDFTTSAQVSWVWRKVSMYWSWIVMRCSSEGSAWSVLTIVRRSIGDVQSGRAAPSVVPVRRRIQRGRLLRASLRSSLSMRSGYCSGSKCEAEGRMRT